MIKLGWSRSAIAMVIAVVGCTSSVQPSRPPASTAHDSSPERSALAAPQLGIHNGTSIAVTLLVNADVITTVAPSTREEPVPFALPSPPWNVEARSPSGHVLLRLEVSTVDLANAGDVTAAHGRLASVDLSCGRLEVWTGPAPVGEPTFIPGPAGDCR